MEELNQTQPMAAAAPEDAAPVSVAAPTGAGDVSDTGTGEEEYEVLELLERVPEAVKEYLLQQSLTDKRTALYKKYELTDEERDMALYLELSVYFGYLTLADFPDALFSRLAWKDEDEERAAALAADILGFLMMPADPYLGDVKGAISDIGFDPKIYPAAERIKLNRKTFAQAAKEIVEKAEVEGLDQELRHRLEKAIESFLRGIRDELETKEQMSKPRKTGGAGLDAAQAEVLIVLAKEVPPVTVLVDEEPVEEVVAEAVEASPAVEPDIERIRQLYAGSPEEQQILASRRETLAADGNVNGPAMRNKLLNAIQPAELSEPEMWLVVAALLMLAESGDLYKAVTEDKRYQEVIIKTLEEQERVADIDLFKSKPEEPRYMSLFLQLVLRRYAGLEMADAARFALRALSLLKKQGHPEYAELAAFDMRDMKFRWTRPEIL